MRAILCRIPFADQDCWERFQLKNAVLNKSADFLRN